MSENELVDTEGRTFQTKGRGISEVLPQKNIPYTLRTVRRSVRLQPSEGGRRNKRGNGGSLRYLCDCKTCDVYSERDEGSTLKSVE